MQKSETLTCDENHQYRLLPSGKILAGTTDVIESVFPYNGKKDEWYRMKGHAIHRSIALEIEGRLDYSSLTEYVARYFNQAMMAIEKLGIITIRCKAEVMLWSRKYLTAGTMDLVDEEYINDFKSGEKSPTHTLQTASYRHLWNINNPGNRRKKSRIIYLDGTEKMPEIIEEKPSDFTTFLAMLEIFNYKNLEGLK